MHSKQCLKTPASRSFAGIFCQIYFFSLKNIFSPPNRFPSVSTQLLGETFRGSSNISFQFCYWVISFKTISRPFFFSKSKIAEVIKYPAKKKWGSNPTKHFRFYSCVSFFSGIWNFFPNHEPLGQRPMSRWKYHFSYDHWSQASWAQPVVRWVKLSGKWWVLL